MKALTGTAVVALTLMIASSAYAAGGTAPKPKPTQDVGGGGGARTGGGGAGTSCQALRQQVQNAYASAGLSAQVAQSAGARAEQECRQGSLVK